MLSEVLMLSPVFGQKPPWGLMMYSKAAQYIWLFLTCRLQSRSNPVLAFTPQCFGKDKHQHIQ